MKRPGFLVLLLVATLLVQNAVAVPIEFVLFDFDDAPYLGGATKIEDYMEDVYGYDITVIGGMVGDGVLPGPLHNYHGDRYLQAGPNWGTSWFSLSFNETPIIAASFDWAIELNAFHAYADDVEIFSEGWGCWSSGNSGIIRFDRPVTTLKFTDSNIWEIELDDLEVMPVPEPATIALLGIGGLVMLTRKKRSN